MKLERKMSDNYSNIYLLYISILFIFGISISKSLLDFFTGSSSSWVWFCSLRGSDILFGCSCSEVTGDLESIFARNGGRCRPRQFDTINRKDLRISARGAQIVQLYRKLFEIISNVLSWVRPWPRPLYHGCIALKLVCGCPGRDLWTATMFALSGM